MCEGTCSAACASIAIKWCSANLMSKITEICNILLFSTVCPQLYPSDVYINRNNYGFCEQYAGKFDFGITMSENNVTLLANKAISLSFVFLRKTFLVK